MSNDTFYRFYFTKSVHVMTHLEKPTDSPIELQEHDYNAPFLHEITPFKHVLMVLFAIVFSIVLVGLFLFFA